MAKNVYQIMFDNGNAVTFDSTVDVDLHKIGMTQYGAGSLAFDDMFINLQHVIYISKEKKVENENISKCCSTCKYEMNPIPAEPCYSCVHNCCDDNPNRTEKWEAKNDG